MKITIDTKEDSHEEIRKVIRMLQNLVGEEKVYSNQGNIFNDSKPVTKNVFGNLFSNDNKEESQLKEEKPSEEEKKDVPEIITYDL